MASFDTPRQVVAGQWIRKAPQADFLANALLRSFAATDGFLRGSESMSYHKVFFAICAGAILVAAPTIPAQQGEEGPKPLPYGFSHETLMDNPLLSASEHPAQHRAFTVPANLGRTFRASETQPGVPPAKGGCRIREPAKSMDSMPAAKWPGTGRNTSLRNFG
jgi:hypothetical protein